MTRRVVLVTDGDQRSALAVVRSLGRAGHEVHVCSGSGASLAGASKYAQSDTRVADPVSDAATYAEDVMRCVQRLSADVLMPMTDGALLAATPMRDELPGVVIPAGAAQAFRDISNKALLTSVALEMGVFAVPSQIVVTSVEEALEQARTLHWPVVIKPARSVARLESRQIMVRVSYASNFEEFASRVARIDPAAFPLLLQERIVGPGIGIFLLRRSGTTYAVFSHRRLREHPPAGGVSVYRESIVADPALVAASEALVDRFGWESVAMIELKVDAATGTPYLMEVNARFWGSLQLAIDSGVDFPRLLVDVYTGKPVRPVLTYRVGVRSRWFLGEVNHVVTRLRHSDSELELAPGMPSRWRSLLQVARWHPRDRLEVMRVGDPFPFLRELRYWRRGAPRARAAGRRVRVLHVVQNLNYGGLERLVAEMVRTGDHDRFEFHVLALEYLGHFAEGLGDLATLHVAGSMTRLSLLRPRRLAQRIKEIAPDVVHCHSGVWIKTVKAARIASIPKVIFTEHGRRSPDTLSDRLVDRLASRGTDTVVVVSKALAGYMRAAHVVGRGTRIVVIENGVNTAQFRPRPPTGTLRRAIGVGPSVPIIGSIGRLEYVKGYDVMLEAFVRMRDDPRSSTVAPVLAIIGDGSERAALEKQVASLGIGDRVHLLGWRDDIHDLTADFSLFTMSSRSEGTSISLLEAMSAGMCPVVTDVGGNAAVLGAELAHRMVPAGDPVALARAWMDALSDTAARDRDAAEARARVCARFSLEASVRAYEQLYAEP